MAIVYIGPSVPVPIGGIKVLYRHVELLRSVGVEAYMWHPDSTGFRCTWFESSAPMWPGRGLDPEQDLVVIPEVWAATEGRQCRQLGVRYAIFVQNGFGIRHIRAEGTVEDLRAAYAHASFVLSISESTTQMIRAAHREVPDEKILRMLPHVSDTLAPRAKGRRITFMPRKMHLQAELLAYCLEQALPRGWTMVPIEDRSELEVEELLGGSSVFLSLSDLEGFGLPPMEAALSGNLVVGYTGVGGREYFDRPLFRAVEHADIPAFLRETLRAVEEVDGGVLESRELVEHTEALRRRYGRDAERACLQRFAQQAADLLAGTPAPQPMAACA